MKEYIRNLISDAEFNLSKLKKSEMNLSDRVAYERALVKLQTAKELLYRFIES